MLIKQWHEHESETHHLANNSLAKLDSLCSDHKAVETFHIIPNQSMKTFDQVCVTNYWTNNYLHNNCFW